MSFSQRVADFEKGKQSSLSEGEVLGLIRDYAKGETEEDKKKLHFYIQKNNASQATYNGSFIDVHKEYVWGGETPLMSAAMAGSVYGVKYLLHACVSLHKANNAKCVLDAAIKTDKKAEIVDSLCPHVDIQVMTEIITQYRHVPTISKSLACLLENFEGRLKFIQQTQYIVDGIRKRDQEAKLAASDVNEQQKMCRGTITNDSKITSTPQTMYSAVAQASMKDTLPPVQSALSAGIVQGLQNNNRVG